MGLFGAFDTLFPIFFFIVFAMVIGTFVVVLGKSAARGIKNSAAPRLTTQARVVNRRENYRRHSRDMAGWTDYYVTFEVPSGDRMELEMSGEQYGLIAEGDQGQLTFQGTRFISFEWNRQKKSPAGRGGFPRIRRGGFI